MPLFVAGATAVVCHGARDRWAVAELTASVTAAPAPLRTAPLREAEAPHGDELEALVSDEFEGNAPAIPPADPSPDAATSPPVAEERAHAQAADEHVAAAAAAAARAWPPCWSPAACWRSPAVMCSGSDRHLSFGARSRHAHPEPMVSPSIRAPTRVRETVDTGRPEA